MPKPQHIGGYTAQHTADCERVLVTLLRGLGPWGKSVFLVGGLTPRYLVPQEPPVVPAHAGTLDVDVVIELKILADTGAYETLERNLQRLGFERGINDNGTRVSWRWQTRTERGATMLLEFLADDPTLRGGRIQELPTKGNISALNVPHSSIVFDLFDEKQVRVELLDERGVAEVTIKHANIVSFTCLKAFAYEDRQEPKDAHDLVYCLEHHSEGLQGIAGIFRTQLAGKHGRVVRSALELLRKRFVDEPGVEGYRKDGPVAVAMFELGSDFDQRERRALRQREASALIDRLLREVGMAPTGSA
jgi:hypothetical protein